MARSLARATSGGRWRRPQSGLTMSGRAGSTLQGAAHAGGDLVRRLDFRVLDVDHAEAERRTAARVALEQLEVVVALARELEHELVDVRLEDGREEEVVVAFPDGPA